MTAVPLLRVDGVTRRFGGLIAVDDVSLTVEQGEIVGLIGPNGAGKTTLFEVVSGYIKPTSGVVLFGGRDVTGVAAHRLARIGIGRTFQIVQPFLGLTVLENVTIGTLRAGGSIADASRRAAQVLERVHLGHRASIPGHALTLPEKKRLELARALGLAPGLLLLDEVMAGLTPTEIDEISDILLEIRASGVTLLIVEHIMRAIMRLSDRIVVLANGRKIADGAPAAIAQDAHVIEAYLGRRKVDAAS